MSSSRRGLPSTTWYELRCKAIPSRYKLPQNVQDLLQAWDDYHKGSKDAEELGRMVRLSPRLRCGIANTISKCATKLKKEPDEMKNCVELIQVCTEILEIADQEAPPGRFPLHKLPPEILSIMFRHIVDEPSSRLNPSSCIVEATNGKTCACPKFLIRKPQVKELPFALGPALCRQFLTAFYGARIFRFRCTCELKSHLQQNSLFKQCVKRVVVHWSGPGADRAFNLLGVCPNLEVLTVDLSKATLVHLNERADALKPFFPGAYRSGFINISDALGFEELAEIRGLHGVSVDHMSTKASERVLEMERASVEHLLRHKLVQPRL